MPKSSRQLNDPMPVGSRRSSLPINQAEADPCETKASYQAIVEAIGGFIYLSSASYQLEFLNQPFIRHLRAEPVGQKCYQALYDREQICPWCPADQVLQGQAVYRETLNPRDNRWYAYTISLIRHRGGGYSRLAVVQDISERKRAEEATRRLAYYDHLTGLPNRVLFTDRLQVALAHSRRHRQQLAVMMLDLDRFKVINDALGHQMGDLLLRGVAARLSGVLRQSDTVARFGGDEFLLIFPEINHWQDVIAVAQKVIGTFQKPFLCEGNEVLITASLGIAIYPDDGEDGDILMKHADTAMYRAKRLGRNNFQCHSTNPPREPAVVMPPLPRAREQVPLKSRPMRPVTPRIKDRCEV